MQRHQREANLPNFLSVQDIKTLYRIALFRAVYPTDVFREKLFEQWDKKRQQEFLDFCTGVRGVKPMYDFISKEILNPETV